MKKKALTVLAVSVMLVGMTGCSSGSPSDTGEAEQNEEAAAEETIQESDEADQNKAEGADDTYTVWAWDANVEAIQEAARVYNEATGENIKLEVVTVVNEDSRNKLVTIGESKDWESLPDFLLMEDTAIAQFVTSYPEMLVDLTDYDISWDDLVASKKSLYTVDGRHYALPMDSGASIAMYRTDYLEEAGYTIDDLTNVTWDRVVEIGKDMYDKTGHYLLLDDATSCFIPKQIYTSSGAQFFDENGKPDIDNDTMRLTLEMTKKLVDNNVMYIAGSWDEYNSCLNAGTGGGVVNGMWINGNISNAPDQKGLWAVTDMPSLDVDGATHMTNSGGASWVVTKHAGDDTDKLVEFLSYELCGEGAQEYWAYLADFAGYLTTYKPVLNSELYTNVDNDYYGETFFSDVAKVVDGAPALNASPYYMDAQDALINAVINVVNGGDIDTEMKDAQSNLEFVMTE